MHGFNMGEGECSVVSPEALAKAQSLSLSTGGGCSVHTE